MHRLKNQGSIFCVALFLLLSSLTLLFFAGSFSGVARIQKSAKYIADYSNTHSNQTVSLVVNEKERSISSAQLKTEFYDTYGVFGEKRSFFYPCANSLHEKEVYFDFAPDNLLSFIVADDFECFEYNGLYRHYYLPIDLMFDNFLGQEPFDSFCFISVRDASMILKTKGITCTESSLRFLLGTEICISIGGTSTKFRIINIFLETGWYVSAFEKALGPCVIAFASLPNGIENEACYFLDSKEYENYYILKSIQRNYDAGSGLYLFSFSNVDIMFDKKLASAFCYKTGLEWLSYFLFSVSASLLFFFGILLYRFLKEWLSLPRCLMTFALSLAPYLIFWVLYYIKNDAAFFSYISTAFYFFAEIMLVICLFITPLLAKRRNVLPIKL